MAAIRYRVQDLPPKGVGAFTPTASTNPTASSWGLVKLAGHPGNMPVAVIAPTRVWAPPISADPKTQGSNNSPDVFFPDVYTPYADNMGPQQHFGMAARRQTPIPIPALSWINTALKSMNATNVGGRYTVPWPRAFQRWPSRASK